MSSRKWSQIIRPQYAISFIATFIIYLLTMNPSSFGYDTTWFHIQVPQLAVGQTTGFPIAFLLGKLFTFLPFGTIAFRLNLFSVFFGAATVTVFVMIVSNLIKKEYYIGLISTLFFCFFRVFWLQTNRFEVYTLHTFLIGLVILFGVYWANSKESKFLYLYYLFIGFSFTNHPLSVFLAPMLIFFPIIIDHKAVFKLKKVVIIIALMIAPLLLYLYIPIRSYQGYGNVKTFGQFIHYITGMQWKQQLGFRSMEVFKKQASGYYNLIRQDFNIAALIVTLFGFVMLAWKKWKYFILVFFLIILNLIPVFLYEDVPNDFYLVSVVTFLVIPFAFGIYHIKEGIRFVFKKIPERKKIKNSSGKDTGAQVSGSFKITFMAVFMAAILFFPVNAFASNYAAVDKSKDTKIYDYWKAVERELEDDSIVFSSSKSTSVLAYILLYESDKNVKIERGLSYEEMLSTIRENIGKNTIYFNKAYMPDLSNAFELEPVSYFMYWMDYEEELKTYKVLGIKKYVGFEIEEKEISLKFGEEKNISYTITNKSGTGPVYMDSIELGLPKSLNLIGINESESDIKVMPGMASGFYMWTNGPYIVEPSEELTISVKVKAVAPDENSIRFRITTNNLYEEAPEVILRIK
ncbi:MAG: DUF2723 domain-containing protein [Actinomycetota bacterium]|nr:DUF2723 domain-containing protein [Actinomycetota bacterium]